MPGARFELLVDSKPRSNRDTKEIALDAGRYLKSRNPKADVAVRDLRTGETVADRAGGATMNR